MSSRRARIAADRIRARGRRGGDGPAGRAALYARVDLVEGLDARPCPIELELIEPKLHLTEHPPTAVALAAAVAKRLGL